MGCWQLVFLMLVIIPRGVAALGYTQQLPTEDRYLMTRAELEDRLCVLLGGRVAEEVMFGDVSTPGHRTICRRPPTLPVVWLRSTP